MPYIDKTKKAANNRDWHLRSKYGITAAAFDQMLASQNGRCAICKTDTPGGSSNVFHVDHCHDTGAVRALLCMDCNTGIGKLQHSPELLSQAAEYLRYHRELH